jgi:hypothetical protein
LPKPVDASGSHDEQAALAFGKAVSSLKQEDGFRQKTTRFVCNLLNNLPLCILLIDWDRSSVRTIVKNWMVLEVVLPKAGNFGQCVETTRGETKKRKALSALLGRQGHFL